MGFIIMN